MHYCIFSLNDEVYVELSKVLLLYKSDILEWKLYHIGIFFIRNEISNASCVVEAIKTV